MAKIFGVELKSVKTWLGEEGYVQQGNIYIDGKKAGFFSEDSHGGYPNFSFNSDEKAKLFDERRKSYFKKKCVPKTASLTKTDIHGNPIETVEVDVPEIYESDEYFMYDLLALINYQKEYKKAVKSGRDNLIAFEVDLPRGYSGPVPLNTLYSVGTAEDTDRVMKDLIAKKKAEFEYYNVRIFKSLDDFIIS